MSEKVLHEFDHDFGRFAIEDQGGAIRLRQVGGKEVDLYHGLDGYILLHEVLRLRGLLLEVAGCEVLDYEESLSGRPEAIVAVGRELWDQIRALRGEESDG